MSSDTSIPPRPGSGAARRQAIAKQKSHSGGKNPLVIVGAVVALIAVALVIAVVAGGGGDDDTVATEDTSGLQEVRPVTVTGEALPGFEQTDGDAAVGLTPTIEGATFNGIEMSLPMAGSPTLLVYLAHWCPHCQAEVPLLTEWDAAGGVPAGVEIFGIATATDEASVNYPPSLWLEEEGFPFAVMADSESGDAGQAMGVTGYPAFVMIDAEGKVVWRASGEVPIDQLQAMIEASLPPA